jgi:hypothetical protein
MVFHRLGGLANIQQLPSVGSRNHERGDSGSNTGHSVASCQTRGSTNALERPGCADRRQLRAFSFNAPILIDSKGGIVAGHGRHLAALKLGLEIVPVIILDPLSELEKRA